MKRGHMVLDRIPERARVSLARGESEGGDLRRRCRELMSSELWCEDGFVVVSGLPVDSEDIAERAAEAFSRALGELLPQDGSGQLIRDVRYRGVSIGEGSTGRYSDSREGGQLHTDGPHRPEEPPAAFALLCVRQSRVGGALVLVRSEDVVSSLDANDLPILQRPFFFDQRQEGTHPVERPILRRDTTGSWLFTYLRQYVELGHAHPGAPALSARESKALDHLDVALDALSTQEGGHREIKLEPGQFALIDNRRLLHGRTAFGEDAADLERLMLRTWIRPRIARQRLG